MKKILFASILILLMAGNSFAVGTCNESFAVISTRDGETYHQSNVKVVQYACTADSSNAAFPSAVMSADVLEEVKGMKLHAVIIMNGSTPPTPLYSVVLNGSLGVDMLGGAGTYITGVASVGVQLAPWGYMSRRPIERPIDSATTLAITGNSVNSAGVTVKLYFVK